MTLSRRPCRLALLGPLAAIALWLTTGGTASAHAHLVQANLAPDSVVSRTPSTALFVFDEPLNPTLTRVRITDSAGHPATTATGYLASGHSGEEWLLPLPPLRPDTYSVVWTSESASDGHVMSSFYTFRVAAHGAATHPGVVDAAMTGMTGAGATDASGPAIDGGMIAITFFSWLGLMAQALWLGALVVELAVLAPARRGGKIAEARLAWAAAPRLWLLARGAPPLLAATLLGQVVSLAVAGTGGDWGRALAPATLGGILGSQNGSLVIARLGLLLIAMRLTGRVAAPASARTPARPWLKTWRPSPALGIIAAAPRSPRLTWEVARLPVTVLAAVYMLLAAVAGHATHVAPGLVVQSCVVDWLHLVCTAAWAGGMAALAYGVLPLRHVLAPEERAPAILPLLDRFSPVAYISVGVLALSGMYSAMQHLDAPSMLHSTVYGQLLLVKLGLVGLLVVLSGSHVRGLRPRIARLQVRATVCSALEGATHDVAAVHEGLHALASRLRLEAWVGAAILLVTALMGQTLPADAAPSPSSSAPMLAAPAMSHAPAAITGTATTGDLRGRLTIAPPMVGATSFTLQVWEHGRPLTGDTAAAIVHLAPAVQPAMRAVVDMDARGARFSARGSIAMRGVWRADVLVRTATAPDYRTLRFTFTVGPNARILPLGRVQPARARAVLAADSGYPVGPPTLPLPVDTGRLVETLGPPTLPHAQALPPQG